MTQNRLSTLNWMFSLSNDAFDQALKTILPPNPPKHTPSDIDDISDDEILRLRRSSGFKLSSTAFGTQNIRRVTEHTVVKTDQGWECHSDHPSESMALQIVAQQTSIPVPHVRRLIRDDFSGCKVIAMEHIPGEQLAVVWPTLSWAGRVRVAFIIRSYILQLRGKIRHPRSAIPGPLGGPGEGGKRCFSPLFGRVVEIRGPFETYAELSHFFNDRAAMTLSPHAKLLKPPVDSSLPLPPFDDTQPLVLTHQDLNPRNFIVGDDGHLWVVDWSWAGFYPPWFEFVAMGRQAENEELVMGKKNPDWEAVIPFICGQFFEQEKWLNRLAETLCWF